MRGGTPHPKGTCSAALHGALIAPHSIRKISHRSIPCPRARDTFPSSWKSVQKSREKPRFLHFLARYIIYRIETFLLHVRGRCFLSQRIKGLSPATAPLPLMLCHGRSVCVYWAGGAEHRPYSVLQRIPTNTPNGTYPRGTLQKTPKEHLSLTGALF